MRKLNPTQSRARFSAFVGPPGVGKTSLGSRSPARSAASSSACRSAACATRPRSGVTGAPTSARCRAASSRREEGRHQQSRLHARRDRQARRPTSAGDPSSALLEVLDPEQNNAFSDHYLEVALRPVEGACSSPPANTVETIPRRCATAWRSWSCPATRRREAAIAEIPHPQAAERARPDAEEHVIDRRGAEDAHPGYTREAGVRNLEREIAARLPEGDAQVSRKGGPAVHVTTETPDRVPGPAAVRVDK